MKKWKPVFIENSRIPVWLSWISPIEIHAISLGWFVWCRGKMTSVTRRHEGIHFQQHLELAFVGFWALYLGWYLWGLWRYRDAATAYRESPFEKEAYAGDTVEGYLSKRKMFAWTNHMKDVRHSYKERIKRSKRNRIAYAAQKKIDKLTQT